MGFDASTIAYTGPVGARARSLELLYKAQCTLSLSLAGAGGIFAVLAEGLQDRRRGGNSVDQHRQAGCSTMDQRDELLCNAVHDAAPTTRFATSGIVESLQLDRGGHFGVAGCALAAAAHRRSRRQRERSEAEREERARAAWPCGFRCPRFLSKL